MSAEKPELRQANDNPWYCLATLYGEPAFERHTELDYKNRIAWNRWIAGALSDEERTGLVKDGFPVSELAPLSPEEKSAFNSAFAVRTGHVNELPPEPADDADFSHTHFDRLVCFSSFLFARRLDFSSVTFSDFADFRLATFFTSAEFIGATFSKDAEFSRATFSGYADFRLATFSRFAGFRQATFSSGANFGAATFSKAAYFINAKFAEITEFAGAGFETHVPDFRGATMHEATEWHGARWPKPSRDKDAAQAQVYAYERLKQEMERLKKHEDEQRFFRRELRARRGLVRPWSGAWLLNLVYEVSSDYGHSINRPLLWLFWLFALGSSILTETPAFKGAPMTISNAAKHSFANIFPFLPLNREIMAADMAAGLSHATGLSHAAQIIAVAQSLLGPLLLFLLGLALRNRFRMRS
jgi:Pentapeptide repeats (9 copies)